MSGEPAAFDLSAAWVRKAQGDLSAFMEGFAARMTSALPGRVRVERRGFALLGGDRIAKIFIAFETGAYVLALNRGELRAERAQVVRGVTLRSELIPLPDWLAGLSSEVGRLADQSAAAQAVLLRFLMS